MIEASVVKELRERTGCGMMDCKKALTETGGDMEQAIVYLREKGLAAAAKKSGRIAAEGIVGSFIGAGVGVLVEVNSETDFVAKNDEFRGFVTNVAKQVAKENPADVDVLLDSKFIGNDAQTVREALNEKIATIGENMNVRRFVRFEGEVEAYIHGGGRIGVLVQFKMGEAVNDEQFAVFKKDIAMQIAAAIPMYIAPEDVPAEILDKEREILKAQAINEGKPENIALKMVEGRISKYYKEACLLDQPYVKDPDKSVRTYMGEVQTAAGTSIEIVNFMRFEKGEGLDKKEDNFADEVKNMLG